MKKLCLLILTLSTAASASLAGGSHSGQPLDSFKSIQTVAADATDLKITDLKKIKVPTTVLVTGEPCLLGDEYAQNCEKTSYGDYVAAYEVTVSYVSDQTQLIGDEYPQGNEWTTSFVLKTSDLNPALAQAAIKANGSEKTLALQKLLNVRMTTLNQNREVMTQECARELVGETEWRKVDSACQDEVTTEVVAVPAIQIAPNN